ncbi:MAG: hypothetical protein ABI707_11810 [Ferruginibacter sp.]
MKKQSTNLFATISTELVKNLTTIVKETVVKGYNQPQSKIFTAGDLWNIQRQGKTRTQRRFSF